MKRTLLDHFSRISPLSQEEENAISDGMIITFFKKGQILLKEGQVPTDTYFVLEGCVREYVEYEGEEKTTNFFTEGQWIISLGNHVTPEATLHNLICAEDCSLMTGNEKGAQEIFKKFPRFETIARAVMENYFTEQRKILTSYLIDSPEQRYLKLLKSRPDLFQRIPQYQLASYIGVKPETLSRIRKRIMLDLKKNSSASK
jgi:CRP-like cAMP-binding protein